MLEAAGSADKVALPKPTAASRQPKDEPRGYSRGYSRHTAWLMKGWLQSRLGIVPKWEFTDRSPRMHSVELQCANGDCVRVTREENTALFSRTGQEDRYMPLPKRPVGDELAEELRRLDADQIYSEALGAMAGVTGLDHKPAMRVHVWKDPALAARADEAGAMAGPGGSAA